MRPIRSANFAKCFINIESPIILSNNIHHIVIHLSHFKLKHYCKHRQPYAELRGRTSAIFYLISLRAHVGTCVRNYTRMMRVIVIERRWVRWAR